MEAQEETAALRWGAELHRLEGIALVGLNQLKEGQKALEEALRVARGQQAKAYELRAATNLASTTRHGCSALFRPKPSKASRQKRDGLKTMALSGSRRWTT